MTPRTIFTFNNSPTSISGKVKFGKPSPLPYSIGGASPELVAAFTTASDGTTVREYFRLGGADSTFGDLFTFSRSGRQWAKYWTQNGIQSTQINANETAIVVNGVELIDPASIRTPANIV